MLLLRGEREVEKLAPTLDVWRDCGIEFQTLNAEKARAIEPALRPDTALAQALHFAQDDVGNCRQFTLLLKQEAERLGVEFYFNTLFNLCLAPPPPFCKPRNAVRNSMQWSFAQD